ncbi:MAG: TRAP transporter small permease subunit [Candidatus Rokuibacteriota bacterium]
MSCVAGWLFVVAALFVSFDVISRKFFGFSSQATVELTGYMLAFGIAWGLTDALTTRSHIRVDVLLAHLPVGARAYMHALASRSWCSSASSSSGAAGGWSAMRGSSGPGTRARWRLR